jgi:hypothetical protein
MGFCLWDFVGFVDGALVAPRGLTLAALMFHLCSHGSRDDRRGAKPGLEGPHALRQRLSAGDALHAQVRLPQAAGPPDAGCDARAELPTGESGRAADVSCLRESPGGRGL